MNIDTYQYQVFFSEEDHVFIATVAEFPYLSADGERPEDALAELRSVVKDSVEILSSEGKELPQPLCEREFKGNISLRLSPETHRLVTARAREERCSVNQFLTSLIERNIFANSIESVVKLLERVAADTEVSQVVRKLVAQPGAFLVGSHGQSPYQGTGQPFNGNYVMTPDDPFSNTSRLEQRGI